jgi:hypothetical protein
MLNPKILRSTCTSNPVNIKGMHLKHREQAVKCTIYTFADMLAVNVHTSGTHLEATKLAKYPTCTSLRVNFSSSRSLSLLGSTVTPPFAPPKGMSITAVFQVIKLAKLQLQDHNKVIVSCGMIHKQIYSFNKARAV